MLFDQKQFVGKLNAVNEYEREPVPANKLKGWKSFLGMYAGEHTAGTEFVIGPLFVAHGVTAPALIVGLLVGNVLATLSWALLCAPVATKNRITLYYQLEKICGPGLTRVYNLVNALMFCFLAGSMIAVSATAVGIPFDLAMPSLNDIYPNSMGWVLTVGVVGAICVVIAGWTTANPTIYRAGLAVQSIMPRSKTWKVTLVVGGITTLAACFPGLVMRLLDFVALYGLVLMPMGAIIFIDVWVLPKLGLLSNFSEQRNGQFNWAAALTWLLTLVLCLGLNWWAGIDIFFLGLPGWFVAVIVYMIGSKLMQASAVPAPSLSKKV